MSYEDSITRTLQSYLDRRANFDVSPVVGNTKTDIKVAAMFTVLDDAIEAHNDRCKDDDALLLIEDNEDLHKRNYQYDFQRPGLNLLYENRRREISFTFQRAFQTSEAVFLFGYGPDLGKINSDNMYYATHGMSGFLPSVNICGLYLTNHKGTLDHQLYLPWTTNTLKRRLEGPEGVEIVEAKSRGGYQKRSKNRQAGSVRPRKESQNQGNGRS